MIVCSFFLFQAEDGIRDLVRSRGLGDVYKRQDTGIVSSTPLASMAYIVSSGYAYQLPFYLPGSNLSLIHI